MCQYNYWLCPLLATNSNEFELDRSTCVWSVWVAVRTSTIYRIHRINDLSVVNVAILRDHKLRWFFWMNWKDINTSVCNRTVFCAHSSNINNEMRYFYHLPCYQLHRYCIQIPKYAKINMYVIWRWPPLPFSTCLLLYLSNQPHTNAQVWEKNDRKKSHWANIVFGLSTFQVQTSSTHKTNMMQLWVSFMFYTQMNA